LRIREGLRTTLLINTIDLNVTPAFRRRSTALRERRLLTVFIAFSFRADSVHRKFIFRVGDLRHGDDRGADATGL